MNDNSDIIPLDFLEAVYSVCDGPSGADPTVRGPGARVPTDTSLDMLYTYTFLTVYYKRDPMCWIIKR